MMRYLNIVLCIVIAATLSIGGMAIIAGALGILVNGIAIYALYRLAKWFMNKMLGAGREHSREWNRRASDQTIDVDAVYLESSPINETVDYDKFKKCA